MFDDGGRSVAEAALPVLRDAGVPAHLFLCTGWPERDSFARRAAGDFDMIYWDGVERLHRGGVSVESHTHANLRGLFAPDRGRMRASRR